VTDDGQVPRTYPYGVPCWIDLEVHDLRAAQAFYRGLFGWSFADAVPEELPGHYLIATLDGQDVAAIGSIDPAANGVAASATWATYIAVDDADSAADAVRAAGGTVTSEPADAGPGGRAVSCTDPQGVPFRLWQARRRLGAQLVNVPGSWNFSDLLSEDLDAAIPFYAEVFGWRSAPLWEGGDPVLTVPGYGDHLAATVYPDIHEQQSFAPEDFADVVAGSTTPPPGDGPRWRVTFSVEDLGQSVATAEQLGAVVLRRSESPYARTADLRDALGAELTLSQFRPPDAGASWT